MRPTFDQYNMSVARTISARATCDRKHVGAVIVSASGAILSTGYNGAPRGLPHCDDVGHELKDMGGRMSCVRTVHAEKNAIINAARHGVKIEGGLLYTTASPCHDCALAIVNAGLHRVLFAEEYAGRYGAGDTVGALFKLVGIEFVHEPG